MMEGNADKTSVTRQVSRAPGHMSGFVEQRRCEVPRSRGIALTFVVWPQEGVAPHHLNWHRILVRLNPGFERAIERAKEQILRLSAQFRCGLQFLWRRLKERHLFLFFFAL